MDSAYSALMEFGASRDGLIAANAALSLLFAVWIVRYRRLYVSARNEHQNSAELIEHLSEGVYRSSLDGKQLSANRALVRLNGYDNEAEMLEAVTDIAVEWYVEPGRRDEFREILRRDGKVEDFVSEIYRHKSRERIWITESARIVRQNKTGKPLYYEGSVREITETVRRFQVEERFQKLTRAVPGSLYQCVFTDDGRYTVPYISAGFELVSGLSAEAVRQSGKVFLERIHPDDREGYAASLRRAIAAASPWDHEFRFTTPGGVEKWFRISATIERTRDGVILHGYLNDISVRKKQAIEIEKLAYFDALTGLPNRRLLIDRVAKVVEACRLHRRFAALLFIDLDNFKTLNDTQGHDVGDEYLAQVADRLRKAVGPDDTVARIGGDEFVVILQDIGFDPATGDCRATGIARAILREMSSSFHLGVVQHQSSASVGFVAFDGTPVRVEELLKRADIAMYEAKTAGRNRIAIFDPAILTRETERYQLINDLRFAICEHRFELAMRPRVSREGRICGAQADVVWRHPDQGVISPAVFAPLALQLGLGEELGKVIASTGLATLQRWQGRPATAGLRLALNIGVAPLASPDFLPFMERLVARTGVDASRLTLEIGEDIADREEAAVAARMGGLKRLGIRFSLDRFGSGKPPLTRLKNLPFDEVRVAGPFIADIGKSHYDRTVAEHMFTLAARLGLASVAGDVDNLEQEAILRGMGCEIFEGPNYGAALPENLFVELVLARTPKGSTPPLADRKLA